MFLLNEIVEYNNDYWLVTDMLEPDEYNSQKCYVLLNARTKIDEDCVEENKVKSLRTILRK